jgi:hypothetical protein
MEAEIVLADLLAATTLWLSSGEVHLGDRGGCIFGHCILSLWDFRGYVVCLGAGPLQACRLEQKRGLYFRKGPAKPPGGFDKKKGREWKRKSGYEPKCPNHPKGQRGERRRKEKKRTKTKREGKANKSSRGPVEEPRGESLDITDAGWL